MKIENILYIPGLTQESNQTLRHCKRILCQLSNQGSLKLTLGEVN